jgi:hypothetical protein
MPKTHSDQAPRNARRARRFSLVSDEAQQQMYEALRRLNSVRSGGKQSGAEVAEIAISLAAGEDSPLILACPAHGASILGRTGHAVGAGKQRLTAATLAAMDALLRQQLSKEPIAGEALSEAECVTRSRGKKKPGNTASAYPIEAAAIVCAGQLDSTPEAERDYRTAFGFAARHKLPILYLIANRLAPGEKTPLDLRWLYPEFGMPLFTVDAADAVAAYRVATEALHNARHLRGPCVIEALTVPPQQAGAASPLELLTAYMERHGNPPR